MIKICYQCKKFFDNLYAADIEVTLTSLEVNDLL